ncbi:acyl-CoA dehydrogenase family protein [Amycolatopsis thermoflava]|uniref:acyl-CoA dehydrogenase family protein n=1 Tax=Amycolatopsis thermoflava TaxID=84480 RepID=UPI00364C4469
MSTIVQLALAVGDRVSLSEASALTALARESGVAAIRLADTPHTLDPTVTASHLAGVHSGIGFVAEVPTTHHAPYNTARRVSSLDRATGGRAGIALLAGDGDDVSDATAPDPAAADPARRWSEYAGVLTRLWESFPSQALIGDQDAALVVREELIRPVGHDGVYYRVAGPLDGPSSAQGRPVVVADLGVLDPAAVAESALTASGTTRLVNVRVSAEEIAPRDNHLLDNPWLGSFAQLYLAAIEAGIAAAALDDAAAFGREKARPIKHSSASRSVEDPYVRETVGEIAARAHAARSAVLLAAEVLERVRGLSGAQARTVGAEAAVTVAQAGVVAIESALRAAELLFDVAGGSITDRDLGFDRHWRNARVVANHNPRRWKAAVAGAYHLTGEEPPTTGLF